MINPSPPKDYVRCSFCGTHRPAKETFTVETTISGNGLVLKNVEQRCNDRKWCDEQRQRGVQP